MNIMSIAKKIVMTTAFAGAGLYLLKTFAPQIREKV